MLSHRFTLPEHVSISSRYFTENVSETSTTTTCCSSISPALSYQSVLVSGPLGSLSFTCPPSFSYDLSDHPSLLVEAPSSFSPILFRSFISLFSNSITGVSIGFKFTLSLSGVGFKASLLSDNLLELAIGFSHPVLVTVPEHITVSCPTPTTILAQSFDLPLLSSFVHSVRLIRPSSADHYKGKGLALLS